MDEFISLGDEPQPRASEDLHQPLQVDAVDLNLNLNHAPPQPEPEPEPLPSQHHPQGTKASTSSVVVEVIDLEEGQIACQQSSSSAAAAAAQDAAADNPQAKAKEEALGANGVGPPPPPSHQQPQDDDIIDLEEGQVEDMDLSDDNALVIVTKQHACVSAAETPMGNNDGPPLSSRPSSGAFIDQSRILLCFHLLTFNCIDMNENSARVTDMLLPIGSFLVHVFVP